MDLTTVARCKDRLEISGAQHDTVLGRIVTSVSAAVERFLNRYAEQKARTEQYDVRPGQQTVFLKGYPVAAAPAAVFKNSMSRDFSGGAVDASGYYLNLGMGTVEFDLIMLIPGSGCLQATYTGGMGVDQPGFTAAYPDVTEAVEAQVAYTWQRRNMKGVATLSSGGASISLETPTIELQPGVREMLKRHRRSQSW